MMNVFNAFTLSSFYLNIYNKKTVHPVHTDSEGNGRKPPNVRFTILESGFCLIFFFQIALSFLGFLFFLLVK